MSAYTQFGYPYATAASQLLMPGSQPSTATVAGAGGGTSCCETGRVVATDPVTGQAVCSCQYEPGRLAALNSYPRLSTGSSLHYSAAGYPAGEQAPYPSIGVDSASYFSSFSNPYGLKESGGADMGVYGGLSSTAGYGYSPYDPSLYGYGAPYDLAARRKNATRESTGTLKAWLNEHKKNPYPTKGEKIMLAIITKMTLTQVSTWFANARRRLKKENKMTWEPKNKTESDEEADDNAAAKDKTDKEETDGEKDSVLGNDTSDALSPLDGTEVKSETLSPTGDWKDKATAAAATMDDCNDPQKPKIWSLADTAIAKCKTPPPAGSWPVAAGEAATTFPLPPTIGPGGTPFGRYSHPSQSQAQAAQSQAQPVQSQSQSQSSSAAAAGYHHSPAGGGYGTASGGGGGGYGGMAAPPPPPGLASAGYSDTPQTDTPPQTPPNLKLGQLAGGSSSLGKLSQLGGGPGGSLGYGGYPTAMSSGGRLPTGLERRADGYPAGQLSAPQQQQQHHTHMQQQQQQQHQQQQQQIPLDMNSYAAAYKDGSSASIPPAEYVSPV